MAENFTSQGFHTIITMSFIFGVLNKCLFFMVCCKNQKSNDLFFNFESILIVFSQFSPFKLLSV